MTLEQMLAMVGKMFPNANLKSVFQQAQKMVQGTPDTLQGVSSVARNVGIDKKSINDIFNRYGNTAQAKMLCAILGTTPEALKKESCKCFCRRSGQAGKECRRNKNRRR